MRFISFIASLLFVANSYASHIVGGDIYYDYLGNNNYRFYISMYRDCNSTGAQFDNPLNLAIYNSNNTLVQNVTVGFPGSNVLPVVFNNPCVTPPNNICIEKAVYEVVVNLPPAVGGYTISYQRCCRGPDITNLVNPDDTGFTLTCRVPGFETGEWENSSPRYTNYPPLLLCNNDDLIFDHSATDPDGDQLVYSLVTPFSGGSSFDPQPIPAPPPNYAPVQWSGGFGAAQPLGPGATINIDPNTGLLTASPQMLGLFVVGIRVQELRNGVVINQTTRDFLFRVFNCELQLEAIVPEQEDMAGFVSFCNGLTVNFDNNSYGGTNYSWDFGVLGTNNDVSTVFEPTFTYPAPGDYQAMLVVNPGWPCTDTSYVDIYVNNELEVSFTSNDSLCIFGNSFDFLAQGNGPPTTIFNWDFGPNTATPTGVGQNVNGVEFTTTGQIEINLEGVDGLCVGTYVDTIFIFPEPIAVIGVPNEVECEGLDIQFESTGQNSNTYDWDFGDTQSSNEENPLHNYAGPGTYLVTLISGSTATCKDTTEVSVTINDPLIVSFTSQDSLCITTNSFDFDGTVSGPPNSVFTWNFGQNASIQTSTDEDVNDVVFGTTGSIPITLTGTFENCVESITQSIYIFQAPTIDFYLIPGLQCAPFEAHFVDQSFAETSINYLWDFGNNGTSNEQNPIHLYPNVGTYPVSLTIWTEDGCIDTLFKLEPDLVNVHPNPVAGFTLSPTKTDICHSLVEFTDESQGASIYSYTYGDGTEQAGEANPAHIYLSDGNMYPIQYVENEFGCTDSVRGHVYIEPFPLYIPNTFTPDGDEFNNTFKPSTYLDVFAWNMKIYNRWGHVVFETNDFDIGWDGTMPNGFLAPDGVYLYSIEMETCEPVDPLQVINGHVSILR